MCGLHFCFGQAKILTTVRYDSICLRNSRLGLIRTSARCGPSRFYIIIRA